MLETIIKFKKLDENAITPTYGSYYAAGADLYACLLDQVEIKPNETYFIKTGLALEIPEHLVGLIYARSGLSCNNGLAPANKVGVIDSDYRGEIIIALHNHSNDVQIVKPSDRIAQIVFTDYHKANFIQVEVLNETARGDGGFGSTGISKA